MDAGYIWNLSATPIAAPNATPIAKRSAIGYYSTDASVCQAQVPYSAHLRCRGRGPEVPALAAARFLPARTV